MNGRAEPLHRYSAVIVNNIVELEINKINDDLKDKNSSKTAGKPIHNIESKQLSSKGQINHLNSGIFQVIDEQT